MNFAFIFLCSMAIQLHCFSVQYVHFCNIFLIEICLSGTFYYPFTLLLLLSSSKQITLNDYNIMPCYNNLIQFLIYCAHLNCFLNVNVSQIKCKVFIWELVFMLIGDRLQSSLLLYVVILNSYDVQMEICIVFCLFCFVLTPLQ